MHNVCYRANQRPRREAITLNNLGVLAGLSGALQLARQYFESRLVINLALDDPHGVASATLNLAQLAWHGQQFDQARDDAWNGVQIARRIGGQSLLETALNCLAGIIADAGDPIHAAMLWGAAARIHERLGLARAAAEQSFHTQTVEAARAVPTRPFSQQHGNRGSTCRSIFCSRSSPAPERAAVGKRCWLSAGLSWCMQ